MTARAAPILALGLALAGCGQSDGDPGPGAVTVGDARALDQAARDTDINASEPGNAVEQEPE